MLVAQWFFDYNRRHPTRDLSAWPRMIVGDLQDQEFDSGSWDAVWGYSLIQECRIEMGFEDETEYMISTTVLEQK